MQFQQTRERGRLLETWNEEVIKDRLDCEGTENWALSSDKRHFRHVLLKDMLVVIKGMLDCEVAEKMASSGGIQWRSHMESRRDNSSPSLS